ncbi:hypothetical protein BJ741DRAFT_610877 [Chytriomyces cf. hyalinus JEL632]|nr:hypothetical protein BJ741DRAFT_610877 [Chytriomyces cf. hyalinus JEL632]
METMTRIHDDIFDSIQGSEGPCASDSTATLVQASLATPPSTASTQLTPRHSLSPVARSFDPLYPSLCPRTQRISPTPSNTSKNSTWGFQTLSPTQSVMNVSASHALNCHANVNYDCANPLAAPKPQSTAAAINISTMTPSSDFDHKTCLSSFPFTTTPASVASKNCTEGLLSVNPTELGPLQNGTRQNGISRKQQKEDAPDWMAVWVDCLERDTELISDHHDPTFSASSCLPFGNSAIYGQANEAAEPLHFLAPGFSANSYSHDVPHVTNHALGSHARQLSIESTDPFVSPTLTTGIRRVSINTEIFSSRASSVGAFHSGLNSASTVSPIVNSHFVLDETFETKIENRINESDSLAWEGFQRKSSFTEAAFETPAGVHLQQPKQSVDFNLVSTAPSYGGHSFERDRSLSVSNASPPPLLRSFASTKRQSVNNAFGPLNGTTSRSFLLQPAVQSGYATAAAGGIPYGMNTQPATTHIPTPSLYQEQHHAQQQQQLPLNPEIPPYHTINGVWAVPVRPQFMPSQGNTRVSRNGSIYTPMPRNNMHTSGITTTSGIIPAVVMKGMKSKDPLKPGDWICPNAACRFHNFARRISCVACGISDKEAGRV